MHLDWILNGTIFLVFSLYFLHLIFTSVLWKILFPLKVFTDLKLSGNQSAINH